jgi:hypothetical protein
MNVTTTNSSEESIENFSSTCRGQRTEIVCHYLISFRTLSSIQAVWRR